MSKVKGQRSKVTAATSDRASGKRLKVTLVRSPIGFNKTQGETVTGMGLRRLRHTVDLPDTPETRGMIHKVRHLVEVAE